MSAYLDVFVALDDAITSNSLINREGNDKEYMFQNWFASCLTRLPIAFDQNGRNTYPDFNLVKEPVGFELKALAYPGRQFDFDCNSQYPSGLHNGREVFYVFGRYPKTRESSFPVYDLVLCHGDFLNADSDYVHKNAHVKGFGSYGDIFIRDRKMYVARTPFGIATGLTRQITLIAKDELSDPRLRAVGTIERTESDKLLVAYSFDLKTNALTPTFVPNPNAGKAHRFFVYRKLSAQDGQNRNVEEAVGLLTRAEVEKEEKKIESSLDN